jgi:hypothetical protein
LDGSACEQIMQSQNNLACRHLIERQPELVYAHATTNTRFITDLDTPQDMADLSQKTGWKFALPAAELIPAA